MEIDWTKPIGKTQVDLDAEQAAAEQERRLAEARAYLEQTDYLVVKAAEEYLSEKGLLDMKAVAQREDARRVIREAEMRL